MSSSLIVLGAYALVAAPAVFHWLTGRGGAIIASLYIAIGLAVLANLIVSSSSVPPLPAIAAGAAPPAEAGAPQANASGEAATSQCGQLVAALRNAKVIVDTSKPPEVVVSGSLWQQIPAGQRGAVVTCIGQELPAGSGSPRIVER